MDFSSLTSFNESFQVKVDILVVLKLAGKSVDEMFVVLVGVGIDKGKFDPVLLFESKFEAQFWFVHWIVLYEEGSTYIWISWVTFSKGWFGYFRTTGW